MAVIDSEALKMEARKKYHDSLPMECSGAPYYAEIPGWTPEQVHRLNQRNAASREYVRRREGLRREQLIKDALREIALNPAKFPAFSSTYGPSAIKWRIYFFARKLFGRLSSLVQ